MVRRTLVIVHLCMLVSSPVWAQGVVPVELRQLVDSPTAGLLSRGSWAVDLRLFPAGGVLAQVAIGLMSRLTAGFSYGGLNIIGQGRLHWNPDVEFQAKLRFYDETFLMPAIAIGFDSQGYGRYDEAEQRYQIKSKGAYAVLSKSFWMLGPLGLHAGVNYSLENEDRDDDLSLFAGVDKSLPAGFLLLAEYDLGLNDDSADGIYGTGNGYLNAGVRWTFAKKLSLEFDLKNLANNRENGPYVSRQVRITYWERF
ncbi:MAG: hypothetical protein ACE5OR_00530 [bacterium]